jgi:hypothetical protein
MKHTKKLAIFDPFTKHEFDTGVVEDTLKKYLDNTPSTEYCFDIFYLYNTGNNEYYKQLKEFEAHPNINKIILLNQNIPAEYDTYHKNCILEYDGSELKHELLPCPDYLPPLGGTSGPNLSFYIAIDMMVSDMYDYEHYFMIENDSFPVRSGWFDHIYEYVDNLPSDYLIAGSTYKGHQKWHHVLNYKDHLNGIALYNNTPELLKYVQEGRHYHESLVSRDNWSINFDVALDKFTKTQRGRELTNNSELLLDTNFITNVSDPLDSYMSVDDILELEPETVIVHQKTHTGLDPARTPYVPDLKQTFPPTGSSTSVPFFLRTPRVAGNFVLRYVSKQLEEHCKQRDKVPYFFKVDMSLGATCDMFAEADKPIFDAEEWTQYRQGVDPQPPNRLNLNELVDLINKHELKILFISNDPFVKNLSSREIIYHMKTLAGELSYYTLMRDAYERTRSLCRFNTDEQFLNYIESAELQDSWVIRTLCNLDYKREIEYFHYEYARSMLNHFNVRDVQGAKDLVDDMLRRHYDIIPKPGDSTGVETRYYRRSKNKTNFKQQDLVKYKYLKDYSITLSEVFDGRTYFEQKLYSDLLKSS